ncbi:hypothetical protein RvY_04000 [Ramazzottius varieornatus]|uniref:PBP domain-containing protein n=1 Tax=Ramazzottius varieornatus TaxID=947166 RepID=A0A1D1UZC1_RAMVA|nr:hypothetical protein RvY_04000 [Ramazzottius varieornatus]
MRSLCGEHLRFILLLYLCKARECEVLPRISLNGIGSSAARQVMEAVLSAYKLVRSNVVGNYTMETRLSSLLFRVVGGRDPAINVSFGAVFGQTPVDTTNTLITIPVMAQSIVIIYNLPNITLRLDKAQFVGIFSRTIKRWSDPKLATAGVQLPDAPIEVWIRAQGSSGPLVRRLMAKYDNSDMPDNPRDYWPQSLDYRTADSAFGEAGGVAFYNNTIGFVGYSTYMTSCKELDRVVLQAAWMPNSAGVSIEPTPGAVSIALSCLSRSQYKQEQEAWARRKDGRLKIQP